MQTLETDAAPLKSETVAVLNEVGKIKTELRDILTEADKLKQGLIQQQVEKGAAHSSKSLFRRTDPSPLDEYLVEAACGPSVPEDSRTVTPTGFLPVQRSSVHHFADAEHILKDVQRRRENLENNLEAVERQREEQDLYNLVDNIPLSTGEFDGMLRIRRDVDKKIEELTSAVQREIEQDNRMAPIQRDASSPLNKPKSQGVKTSLSRATGAKRSLSTGPPDLGNRGVKKNEGKENLPEKGVLKKSKPAAKTAAPPKKSSKLTPAQKQDYVSSVYGRQPYQPQRTTSKAPYLHYHSPVNPKTAAVMAGLMAGANRAAGKPVPLQDLTSLPVKEAVEPKKTKADARKQWLSPREQPAKQNDSTRYFFHPTVDLSQVGSREGRSRVAVPMEGQLVPMAIPLGKPKTDPALRPPVATNAVQGTSEMQAQPPSPSTDSTSSGLSPVPTPARSAPVPGHSRSAQSNVAVITVYDKELGDQTDQQQKQRSKSPAKKRKKQSSLNVQVLPTVDIDSYSESSYSSPRPPFIDDIPEPLSRPHDSEYQEFRNYLAVTDMESGPQERKEEQPEDQEDDFHSIPTPQNYLTLEGLTAMDGRPYNGPPFPPEHPSMPPHPSGGVLEADARQEEALQERAMEWIEQELLARIVSEMNQPLPDPTSLARPQPTPERSSMSEAEDEDADMLAATIGLGGIQLFIDAGLPVDRHLVNDLIREVIEEKVTTVLGHPKPRASLLPSRQETLNEDHPSATPSPRGTPLSTPVPTPDYTPPESEESAHESAVLATPECTPTPSVSSEELSPSDAREEPFEPIHEEPDPEEKTSEQVSEVRTPVATPVPTPPGDRSSPVSIATPEPSIREPEWSEQGTVVTTPPPSVVVQTSTPEPEPEPETNVTEEPSSPEEPSVSVTKLTPPKPAQPSVSSPSTTSTLSTRGTTTVTTEEELSEGEMIQPYVHTGMYSEGEFAVFPDIVQLAVERKLPVGGDWDSMLGGDEDSRNELVRVALNGILHHGEGEERRGLGEREGSSSSSSESPDQQSTASTLRDTDDIKEDSITDVTQSEGEVRFQDPMAILLTRIQQHMRSAENSVSEGELLPEHLRTPDRGHRATGLETDPKTVPGPGDVSPGEVVWEQPVPSHGESTPGIKSQGQAAVENQPNKVVVAPRAAETEDISVGEPSHHDRSLHASDLLPGTLGTDFSLPSTQQTFTTPKVIYVEQQDSEPEQSHSNSPRTYSLDEDRRAGTTVVEEEDAKGPAVSTAIGSRDRSTQAEKREDVNGREEKESEPQLPTRIQVTLPSMNDIHETSVESEALVDIEQDTFGDVSSISGGDF